MPVSIYVYMCVCSVSKSCQTLCDPMDHSLPGSNVHGILQARIQEWVAMSSSSVYMHIYIFMRERKGKIEQLICSKY